MKTLSDFIGPYIEPQAAPSVVYTPRFAFSSSNRASSSLEDLSAAPSPAPMPTSEPKGYLPHTPSESNILRQSLDFIDANDDFVGESSPR